MPKSKRGFTLIELLIVIAIIIVLAAMLVLGMKHVLKSGKEAATKLTLSNLQAMLADLDGKTRLSTAPAAWTWYENATAATLTINAGVATTGKTVDFWHIPASFPAGTRSYDTLYDAMDAPGVVTESDSISQNGCRAILNTEFAMQLIMGLPANRSAIEKLSPNQLFLPEATGATFHSPGPDGVLYTADDTTTESPYYQLNAKCTYKGNKFICITAYDAVSTPTAPSPNPPSANWKPDASPVVPLIKDAWGNPIIFVPGTGMRVRLLNGESEYTKPDGTPYNPTNLGIAIIISPEGQVAKDTSDLTQYKVIKPGRPFFASAGPDGDFTKGDDNVYSFEP